MKVSVNLAPSGAIKVYESVSGSRELYMFDASRLYLINAKIFSDRIYGELVNYSEYSSHSTVSNELMWYNALTSSRGETVTEANLFSTSSGKMFAPKFAMMNYDAIALQYDAEKDEINMGCWLKQNEGLRKHPSVLEWREHGTHNNVGLDNEKLQDCNFFVVSKTYDGCMSCNIKEIIQVNYYKIENGHIVDDEGFIFSNVSSMDELAYLFGTNSFFTYEFVWVTN